MRFHASGCSERGYYICFGDVDNAFQQSPPPSIQCYLRVDDEIEDYYLKKFGVKLDRLKDVIPLWRALQGHPEAGALWERLITDILINKMKFRHATHERNLYVGVVEGYEVLVCRQVDDFASGSAAKEAGKIFITVVRKYVQTEFHNMGIETVEGYFEHYNGIDVFQTEGYIKLGCESYLDRVFKTHGWDTEKSEPDQMIPLSPSKVDQLQRLTGPPEKSPEAKKLMEEKKFAYRTLLGELVYAYVICRLDVGFAVCFLARFSNAPHAEHYDALKQ